MAKVDLKKLEELVSQGYLTAQKHPEADLWVFNYTAKTQYERFWTPDTIMSRGLVVNGSGEIAARPFEKFFNLEEREEALPDEPFEVYEKMDGSLGILYWVRDGPRIATRGSFISKQAVRGTEILKSKYPQVSLDKRYTYLFEIIYPENRVVVDYGGVEDLVLLAVKETETGNEEKLNSLDLPFPRVKKNIWSGELAGLVDGPDENKEGFVIRFETGLRLKIKFSEYVRLHRLVTGVTSKVIWEHLKFGLGVEEILDRVPDEFYSWVKMTKNELSTGYGEIEAETRRIIEDARTLGSRKEQAELIRSRSKNPGIAFAMLDRKDYGRLIWDLIRPVATKPLVEEI